MRANKPIDWIHLIALSTSTVSACGTYKWIAPGPSIFTKNAEMAPEPQPTSRQTSGLKKAKKDCENSHSLNTYILLSMHNLFPYHYECNTKSKTDHLTHNPTGHVFIKLT